MKLINQNAELLIQQDWKKQIEIAARTCYKSEDKIADGTADKMVEMLIKRKHYAMLEHGTIYMHLKRSNMEFSNKIHNLVMKYRNNPYSRTKIDLNSDNAYITTNYRVIKEHGWEDDLKYLCEPTDNHVKRYTFRLTTSISIVRELLRHRVFSFANESTRYCNYSKDKFDNEITYIIPHWLDIPNNTHVETPEFIENQYGLKSVIKAGIDNIDDVDFACSLLLAEQVYTLGIKEGRTPQQMREVLPLCTKSELIMTGFEDDWSDFLNVRFKGATGKPHPDMVELAKKINSALCAEVLANSKPIQILLQDEENKYLIKRVNDVI